MPYSLSDIGRFRVTRAVSGLPVSGVLTAELSIAIKTDTVFPPGTQIVVTDDHGDRVLPVFYISKPGYGGGIAEIIAYDSCRKLDAVFDTSGYFAEDRAYPVNTVVSAIASQCGFTGAPTADVHISEVPYSVLYRKTCREILKVLSECGCGVWYCSNDGQLVFHPFGSVTQSIGLNDAICSGFRIGAVRGPFAKLTAVNTVKSESYIFGSTSNYRQMLCIKGGYITSASAAAVMSQISGTEYDAFTCKTVRTDSFPEAFCGFVYNGRTYSAVSIVTNVTALGLFSRVSAPNTDEDENSYKGAVRSSVENRIMQEKRYGSTAVKYNGLHFESGNESYGFNAGSGGITEYEGGLYSRAGVSGITCTYAPGNSRKITKLRYDYCGHTLSADVSWDGNVPASVVISEEEEE